MTETELVEIMEAAIEATDLPWVLDGKNIFGGSEELGVAFDCPDEATARFLCASKGYVLDLLAEIQRLKASWPVLRSGRA